MSKDLDLFVQINNAVLDLQNAQLQTYERPLKTLARLLNHEDLETTNRRLTAGLDLSAFLSRNSEHQGSMMGSDRLQWPETTEEILGITLLLIDMFAKDTDEMLNFAHSYYYSGSKIIDNIRFVVGQLIIPFARDYKTYVLSGNEINPKLIKTISNKIFVVHGHDDGARESVARFLERMGFEAIILHEQANRGMTIIEKVEANSDVGFAIVLLTPDDVGCKKGGIPEPRARQNVLLELGYFIGKLGRDRVCAIKKGELDIPSDFAGVVWEPMDNGNSWKQALGRELQAVGYLIDWNKVMA